MPSCRAESPLHFVPWRGGRMLAVCDVRVAVVERRAGVQRLQLFGFRKPSSQPQLDCKAFSFRKRFAAQWLASSAASAASRVRNPAAPPHFLLILREVADVWAPR